MVASLLSSKATQLRTKYLTTEAFQRAVFSKKTAVVVGATSGIGEACALRLAEQGFVVVAVGRDRPGRAEAIVKALTDKSLTSIAKEDGMMTPEHEFYACDAFSLQDVYQTAQKIQAKHPNIDALVMTQGMATTQGFTPTKEGNDEKLTLHYYSRIAMIQSLLPALKKRSDMPAVVVSILSGGVHSPYANYDQDPSLRKTYSIKNAADAAGYYNDLVLDQFAVDYHPDIKFVHAAPGIVNTNWGTEFNPLLRGVVRMMQPLIGKSPSDCAELLIGPTILAVEAGESLPEWPEFPSSGDFSTNNEKECGVHIINQYGEAAALTKAHTSEARWSVWEHTKEVLRNAGVHID
eukprot:scaffold34630_cov185-Amphora_coffeaeformis.AAC.4